MTLSVAEMQRLARLLDEALELEPAQRGAWLQRLQGEDAALRPRLREMLDLPTRDDRAARGDAAAPAGDAPGARDARAVVDAGALQALAGLDAAEFRPGQRVGPYQLLRPLGVGGMGEVWLAERGDTGLQRQVALKLPALGLRRGVLMRRFLRERDILGGLTHPNIARLYDAGFDADGQPYLALEYVDGRRIDEYADAEGLDARQRIVLMQQVLAAVQSAHASLVVHRDLKPSNVLVTADGRAMLLDFGIAKLLQPEEQAAAETELTRVGGRALTPQYAAPEQIRGEPIGIAADVWALGVLLHRLLAGELPFRGEHRVELEQAVLSAEAPRVSRAPGGVTRALPRLAAAELDTIVAKALHKRPTERYATVDALSEDLARWLTGRPVRAQPDRFAYRLRKALARNRVVAATAAVGVVAVLTVAVIAIGQARQAQAQAELAGRQAERARQEAARAQAVQGFLLDIFRSNSREQADPQAAQQTTARELLDRGAARVEASLRDAPEARLQVLSTLAEMYFQIGLRQRARDLEQQRVDIARSALAATDPRRAEALLALARHLYDGSERERAGTLLQEATQVLDAAGDHDSPARGALLTQAARFYRYESLREARASAEAALEFQRRRGDGGPALIRALLMAGQAWLAGLDFARAEPLLMEADRLARRRGSDRAAALIIAASELADVWFTVGRIGEAERLLRETATESTRINGTAHGVTLVLRTHLAALLLQTGQTAEGLALQADIRRVVRESPDRFDAGFRGNLDYLLARSAVELGQPALALPTLRETSESIQADVPRSGVLAHRLRLLADALTVLGQTAEADQRMSRAEAVWSGFAAGLDEPAARLNLLHSRARLLLAQGRVEEAAAALQQMAPARLPADAVVDVYALRREVGLAEVALARRDAAEAARRAQSVLERLRAVPAPYRLVHVEAQALRALALAQRDLGALADARGTLERALRLRSGADLPGSLWVAELKRIAGTLPAR